MLKYYPRLVAIRIIKIYQKILSFDHGLLKIFRPYGFCRFKPTCSEYAIEAIKRFGLIEGGIKAAWRVLRCNPWNKGGWDPVSPENKKTKEQSFFVLLGRTTQDKENKKTKIYRTKN